MISLSISLMLLAAGLPLDVPSGQGLQAHEAIVVEPERQILYLGFLAPSLGGDYPITYDRASTDMDALCENVGLHVAREASDIDTDIQEVVIRLMDRPVAYGEANPDAAQFLNAYDITSGECLWN